mmetsp:Transcript_4917/g.16048  ORF Transcript_4917/g.16048 Transcript_4917/m.16048 type:complete len:510 (-) Transcript_4917:117-1646(-)
MLPARRGGDHHTARYAQAPPGPAGGPHLPRGVADPSPRRALLRGATPRLWEATPGGAQDCARNQRGGDLHHHRRCRVRDRQRQSEGEPLRPPQPHGQPGDDLGVARQCAAAEGARGARAAGGGIPPLLVRAGQADAGLYHPRDHESAAAAALLADQDPRPRGAGGVPEARHPAPPGGGGARGHLSAAGADGRGRGGRADRPRLPRGGPPRGCPPREDAHLRGHPRLLRPDLHHRRLYLLPLPLRSPRGQARAGGCSQALLLQGALRGERPIRPSLRLHRLDARQGAREAAGEGVHFPRLRVGTDHEAAGGNEAAIRRVAERPRLPPPRAPRQEDRAGWGEAAGGGRGGGGHWGAGEQVLCQRAPREGGGGGGALPQRRQVGDLRVQHAGGGHRPCGLGGRQGDGAHAARRGGGGAPDLGVPPVRAAAAPPHRLPREGQDRQGVPPRLHHSGRVPAPSLRRPHHGAACHLQARGGRLDRLPRACPRCRALSGAARRAGRPAHRKDPEPAS